MADEQATPAENTATENQEAPAAEETEAAPTPAEARGVMPRLAPGDTVKVNVRIVEGDKQRIQVFQGVIIKVKQAADGGNFTVRRISYGIGVERTFPFASHNVEAVEVVRHGKVRRARLFYLRGLSGKAARLKEDRQAPA